jgi:hypothetical protein
MEAREYVRRDDKAASRLAPPPDQAEGQSGRSRDFITPLTDAAAWPLVPRAQQPSRTTMPKPQGINGGWSPTNRVPSCQSSWTKPSDDANVKLPVHHSGPGQQSKRFQLPQAGGNGKNLQPQVHLDQSATWDGVPYYNIQV